MSEKLISASHLRETLSRYYDAPHIQFPSVYSQGARMAIRTCIELLDNEKDARVHGRWLGTHDGWYYSYSCSECGAEALTKEETMHDQVCSAFCPNCGARMGEPVADRLSATEGGAEDGN